MANILFCWCGYAVEKTATACGDSGAHRSRSRRSGRSGRIRFAAIARLLFSPIQLSIAFARRQGRVVDGLLVLLLTALFGFWQHAAVAQQYPTRPIRLVVPFAPGGGADIIARIIARQLDEAMGEPVVVDNRGGAGSSLGTAIVTKALADGYTLLLSSGNLAMNPWLYKKLPYNAITDLQPIILVGAQPNILVIHPSVPATNIKEFVEFARKQSDKLYYGSSGVGSGIHLAAEMLKVRLKIDMTHVPFKGTGPAISALLGGQIQVMVSTFASALPHVRAGRLRALGITSAKRSSAAPDIPTLMEVGVPDYDYRTWYPLLAPAGTSKAIVNKLNTTINLALERSDVKQLFTTQGVEPLGGTPAELAAYLKAETENWGKIVRASGITPD